MTRIRRASILLAGVIAAALTPLTTAGAEESVNDAATSCEALEGTVINAKQIGAETDGAVVDTATLIEADDHTPEFCAVEAHVDPVSNAPEINIALNLPTDWNGRSMHFGGGGFNGVVVDGLGNVPGTGNAPTDATPATPLERGYVTFGSDSGTAVGKQPAGSFAVTDEALTNYAGDAVKKTRDTAMVIINDYYAQLPAQQFFAGGSKGGHEALVAAQRYGEDYDGIIAYYPAAQNPALPISWHATLQAWDSPGGSLEPAKQKLLHDSVLGVCDGLDGVSDGVISDTAACDTAYSVQILRCADGTDSGDSCLSSAQIKTIQTAATPFYFDFKLANGVSSAGPYPVLQGAGLDEDTIDSYTYFRNGTWPYFIARDDSIDPATFDYTDWKSEIKALSKLYDAVDENVDTFRKGGGKLIIVQGTTDNLVPPSMTTSYVEKLGERYGAGLSTFTRYYIQPGYGHGEGAFDLTWDSLGALETWVLDDEAPTDPVATDANPDTLGRQMPLCEYPAWPKYTGGDQDQSSSFACTTT
ncbi:tannase/feruloyl esterase family alpha/beta hydrolase [Cumulibacter soli]|uniref:tannase/feruloyl esterase family alpha/beta hydrolase n=1 Tax=Cumulibacter soli TaxID=2546344 RepID=UPI001067C990|nr:tannase/feruloyl esterase family alpha/beta hydrolase [Cumulibacter soli]